MKDEYFKAFKESNGRSNEIELGEKLGLDENTTRRILTQLLSEHKIEHVNNGLSEYCLMKKVSKKDKIK
jgi:predicted transcriptional regulator